MGMFVSKKCVSGMHLTLNCHLALPCRICFIGVLASLLFCCMIAAPAASSIQDATHVLTSEERSWLKAHQPIRLGYKAEYPPYLMTGEKSLQSGIFADLRDELSRKLGVDIVIVEFKTFTDLLEASEKKTIDAVYAIMPSRAKKRGLLPTDVFLRSYAAVYTRQGKSVTHLDDVIGKTVAMVKDQNFVLRILKPYLEQVTIVAADAPVEGLRLLSDGKVDMYIGTTTHSFMANKFRIGGISQAYVHADEGLPFAMGVRPDRPELITVLNKGLAHIGQRGIETIVAKWINIPQLERSLSLTPEEREWLTKKHTVRVRVGEYPPTYFVKDGQPFGIAIDLLNDIAVRSGIQFSFIVPSPPFSEDYNGLIQQSGPDLIPTLQANPEREKVIHFTAPYYTNPRFIFTRVDSAFVSSIEELAGKTVAVEQGFLVQEWLTDRHPKIRLLRAVNTKEALQAVSLGDAFAYIGPIRPTATMINRYGFSNLKAAAPSSLPDGSAQMGIRKDWPELRSIIDKALASIPLEKKTAIINKWTPIRFEHGIQASDLVKWAVGISGGVLIVVGAFLLWNRSLAGRVRQRTRELERMTENLEAEMAEKIRAEAALQESRNFTDRLVETANVMIVGLDAEGRVNLFNLAGENITGYTFSELQGKNWFELLTPKERYPQVHVEFSRLMVGGLPKLFENPILTKIGDERVISWCNSEIADGDHIIGILSFGIDITDKKKAERALAESELRFRSLVEQSPISIQLFAPNGILIQANQAWQALWGIPDETLPELLGSYNVLEDEEARRMGLLPSIQKAFNGENVVLPFVEYDSASTLANMEIDGAGGRKSVVQARLYPVKNLNGDIVTVVSTEEDITQRKQDEEKILQYQQRLKALAAQLTLAEEQERRRIAADLHDHVGHSLALARMQLDGLQDSATELERNIIVKDISNIMLQALQETRSLIFALSSPLMNEIGLGAAIAEWLEEQVEKRYGIKTQFSDTITKEHRKTLDENVRALLFRNVRELLTNVIKHSRATTVSVRLQVNGSEIQILIEDDGVGFDHDVRKEQSRSTNGFGLFSVQERMADLGGRCDILSAPGKGCRVILTVPLEKGDGMME